MILDGKKNLAVAATRGLSNRVQMVVSASNVDLAAGVFARALRKSEITAQEYTNEFHGSPDISCTDEKPNQKLYYDTKKLELT